MDVNLESYDHACYVISKAMIRLLRHDQKSSRETDGAVKYEDIVEEFNKKEKEKSRGCFAMVTHRLDFYPGKKVEEPRKGFIFA